MVTHPYHALQTIREEIVIAILTLDPLTSKRMFDVRENTMLALFGKDHTQKHTD